MKPDTGEADMTLPTSSYLKRALTIDALMTGATALLLVFAAGVLGRLLAVPEPLLRYAGIALVPFVVFVAIIARRPAVPRGTVLAIIGLNVAWVAASVWLLFGGRIQPNALGYAFIIAQAVAVALFAEIQYVGLRRATST
jgi:hypothetical protein